MALKRKLDDEYEDLSKSVLIVDSILPESELDNYENITRSTNVSINPDEDRDILEEAATSRGDEGVLEGAAINEIDNPILEDGFDSDDDGVQVLVNVNTNSSVQRSRRHFEIGTNTYVRPSLPKEMGLGNVSANKSTVGDLFQKKSPWDDLKPLQYNYHRTAFDINLDELEQQPWRLPHTDITDYFNYGFTEASWMKYCENQVKLRIVEGLGPAPQNSAASAAKPQPT